jgi:predicted ATP-grasp superfamily ATP-dependent carboligase
MIAWFGQRMSDVFGLHDFLPFCLLSCCDYGTDGEFYERQHEQKIISLEKENAVRENWSNFSLVKLVAESRSLGLEALAHCTAVLPYASTRELYDYIRQYFPSIKYAGIDPELKNKLDNKFFFREFLNYLNIPTVRGKIVALNDRVTHALFREFKFPIVVQFPIGSSGSGTFKIDGREEWDDLLSIRKNKIALITQFLTGLSLNINAVVTLSEVLIAFPSIQLLGFPELTHRKMVYCGNDFASAYSLNPAVIAKVYEQTLAIGNGLRGLGYLGIFGVDFILDCKSEVYPVEVNPRFQGSTQLLANLQIESNQCPLMIYHLSAFGIAIEEAKAYFPKQDVSGELCGAQLILHNLSGRAVVDGNVNPGIYKRQGFNYIYKQLGFTIRDLQSPTEVLLACGVPAPGTIIEPEAPLLRLYTKRPVIDLKRNELYSEISYCVSVFFEKLKLRPI